MKLTNPLPATLPKECIKATKIFQSFVSEGNNGLDGVIPRSVLQKAQGFAFLTVMKAGFLLSARAGSGVVVARLADDTWSAPSAIGTAGMGIGSQAGAELTEFFFVLNSKSAVRSFMSAGSVTLGGALSLALGPIGRTGEVAGSLSTGGRMAAIYTYSKSKGLFGGVSIEGSVLVERQDANCIAYESNVSAQMILSGVVPVPQWADGLISTIESVTGSSGTPRWVRERSPEAMEEYAFSGMGSPNGIMKKKNKSTPKLEFPPKSWGAPKSGGSYFDDWDKSQNVNSPTRSGKSTPGGMDRERDLMDINTPSPGGINGHANGKPGGKNPFHNMTSPFDTTNADIHIPTDHIKSPFDTSALRRSSSSGRPKPARTESETSLKMKSRAAKLSNQLEGDLSFFSKLSLRTPPATQPPPHQTSLIDYSDDDRNHSPFRTSSPPHTTEPDPNLPFHLQEVHVDLDRTNVSLPSSPRGGAGYIKPTLLKKGSSKQVQANVASPTRKYTSDSDEEEQVPKHKRAPSQRFKAQLKEPLDPECVGRAIVRFDFEAVEPGDLSMRKGDIVLILERSDSVEDWWKGKIGSRVGNFPANFVEMADSHSSHSHSQSHELDPFDNL